MISRFVLIAVLVPLAIILIALAVANRAPVAFTLDPFNPGNPALSVNLPLFVLLFAALVCGLLIGAFATWVRQARYRRLAKRRGQEIEALRSRLPAAAPSRPVAGLPGPV